MCAVLEVSRSGYYKWKSAVPGTQVFRKKKLQERISFHYNDSQRRYGSPKITALLRQEGYQISERTVGKYMRELCLRSCTSGKFRVNTTDSNHDFPIAPNLLNQQFKTAHPNEVWVTDITYIPCREGRMYLASVLDLCTREIVGWKLSDRMTTDLVLGALDAAYENKRPKPGLLHHSDRGAQYASVDYRNRLVSYRMQASMSRKGNCYDNACIESFHSILKKKWSTVRSLKPNNKPMMKSFSILNFFITVNESIVP